MEQRLARRAASQYGVVARDQILALGFTRHTIQRWLDGGRLRQVHPSVYAVGAAPLNQHGHWYAALLACRPRPFLSHLSSAAKRGIAAERNGIHITVTSRGGRSLRGVTVHRCRSIDHADVTRIDGLPVTTPARTLLDLAETETAHRLATVFEEVDRRELLDLDALRATAERNPGRRGLAPFLALVERYTPTPGAKEGLEREFQLFLQARGLPLPQVNVIVHDLLVDCWRPEADLVVELDSRERHRHWAARERDVVRDATLLRHGIRTLRVTSRRIREEPDALEADLRALLAHR